MKIFHFMYVGSKFSFIFEKMPDFHRAKNEQYVLKDHDFRLAKITVNILRLVVVLVGSRRK